MEVYGVIYLITCLVTGKLYVGQTTQQLEYRINQHKCGKKQYVDRVIQKYGWSDETFKVEVLEECYGREQLNESERYWIAKLNCKRPNGYNLTDGGDGVVGLKRTPEHCAKIAKALTGKKRTPEHCANISKSKKGKKRSPESIAKTAAANTGKKRTPEQCAKIAKAFTGKKHSPESIAKIAAAQRGKNVYPNLVAELEARKMTYAALAVVLGLAAATVSEKMRGIREKTFSDEQTAKLVAFFGKPAEYLLYHDESLCLQPVTDNRKSLYKNLIAEMDARNMSYTALAKLMGLGVVSVSKKMRGKTRFNDNDKKKLAEIFGKSAEYLLQRFE